jgi:hypothetical protein
MQAQRELNNPFRKCILPLHWSCLAPVDKRPFLEIPIVNAQRSLSEGDVKQITTASKKLTHTVPSSGPAPSRQTANCQYTTCKCQAEFSRFPLFAQAEQPTRVTTTMTNRSLFFAKK